MDDKEWREQAEVLLQEAMTDALEYSGLTRQIYCHHCAANQDDTKLPFVRNPMVTDPADRERHHDNCWVLRVERLLKR